MVQGQSEDDVSTDLPGVQGAVEAPQLYRVVAVEEAVQVQEVVTAAVVVAVPVPGIVLIPDVFDLAECLWLDLVHLPH